MWHRIHISTHFYVCVCARLYAGGWGFVQSAANEDATRFLRKRTCLFHLRVELSNKLFTLLLCKVLTSVFKMSVPRTFRLTVLQVKV